MHACLKIEEILSIICSNVLALDCSTRPELENFPFKGSSDLLSFATTCRAFTNPALDALWYYQPSLHYLLLHVLPKTVFSIQLACRACFLLNRWPTRDEYERLLFYSSRIRIIRCHRQQRHKHKFYPIDNSTYSILLTAQTAYRLPFLPKLKHFTNYSESFTVQAVYPRLTIGSSLRTLVIDPIHWQTFPWDNLAAVVKPYTHTLNSFTLQTRSSSNFVTRIGSPPTILELLLRFQRLFTLAVRNFDLTALVLLHIAGSLPELRRLNFGVLLEDLEKFDALPLPPDEFPSLEELVMDVNSLAACSKFLSRPAFQRLTVLEVLRSIGGGDWIFQPFFHDLASACPNLQHRCFRRNYFSNSSGGDDGSQPAIPLPLATLSALFPLSHITHLSIKNFNLRQQLRDVDMELLASAWPKLHTLELQEMALDAPSPTLTLAGLLCFLHLCPHLKNLVLRVDCVPLPLFAVTGALYAPSLETLNFCTSPLEDPAALMEALRLVCPGLKGLDYASVYIWGVNVGDDEDDWLSASEQRNAEMWGQAMEMWRLVCPMPLPSVGT